MKVLEGDILCLLLEANVEYVMNGKFDETNGASDRSC
jgi:hypothetical protein